MSIGSVRFLLVDISFLFVYSSPVPRRPKQGKCYSESSPEADRLRDVLKTAIRAFGLNRRKVERAMGLSDSYLSRLFSGAMSLRVTHVVEIARALNVEPAEIFAAAFQHRQAAHSPAYELVRVALQDLRPPADAACEAPPEEPAGPELEKMLEMLLLKAIRRIADRALTP